MMPPATKSSLWLVLALADPWTRDPMRSVLTALTALSLIGWGGVAAQGLEQVSRCASVRCFGSARRSPKSLHGV